MQRGRRKEEELPSSAGTGMRASLTRGGAKIKYPSKQKRYALYLAVGLSIFIGTVLLFSARFLWASKAFSKQENNRLSESSSSSSEAVSTLSGGYEYHIVFSTGCSLYQDWQSYVFFYQARMSKQPGTVTRIVSGCDDEEAEKKMQEIFDTEIGPMSPEGRFKLHFTPDYSTLPNGKKFVYFNKPFGMKHWLENALGHPNNPVNKDAIVILLDPDQLIMRPFTNNDFTNTDWKFLGKNEKPYTRVEHGKPMGQLYGFGTQWRTKVDMKKLAPDSPIIKLSSEDARKSYIVGPPYVATAQDMYTIVEQWCAFALPVYEQYPFLLAEMFAYCLAAAHKELPHQTAASFMISDTALSTAEGWRYIDAMPDKEICGEFSVEEVPNVLHFCQRYGMGDYFFGKRKLPKDFLSCESPMLAEPPRNVLSKYTFANFPGKQKKDWTKPIAKRNAFTVCYMIKVLNEAADYYKRRHCDLKTANFEKTLLMST
jgi:peptidyl serine alpha-galactosyltransferase